MAEIVFGAGTSHSPLLAASPQLWAERADQDRRNPELYDNTGVIRSFDDLAGEAGDRFDAYRTTEVWEDSWKRCQAASRPTSCWSSVMTSASCSTRPTNRRCRSPPRRR
jgi:hypothetical protein